MRARKGVEPFEYNGQTYTTEYFRTAAFEFLIPYLQDESKIESLLLDHNDA